MSPKKALALIRLDYEELPAVFDEEEALKPGAPLVHDPRPQQQPAFSKLIQDLPPGTNVCRPFQTPPWRCRIRLSRS
jgi:CO/xanthine dehydrogenase Mo-binding subunit